MLVTFISSVLVHKIVEKKKKQQNNKQLLSKEALENY